MHTTSTSTPSTTLRLYNTQTRTVESFQPHNKPRDDQGCEQVSMYACGPTVYDYTHIGHIRKYVMDDILRRTLERLGYHVCHVMNITDVGHLTSDADSGEDKLEKGAQKTGKTVWEVRDFYQAFFKDTMNRMNVLLPKGKHLCRATEHIPQMIAQIQLLEKNGLTYTTDQAVYLSVGAFNALGKPFEYGQLSRQKLEDKQVAVREDVHTDPGKKHPADFALWFFRKGRFANHTMYWNPKDVDKTIEWGEGFPGWHIECSAMSTHYLGEQIDIHTGGIDHIPVHHENEIAQAEGVSGKHPFVKFWVHHNFLMVEGEKMSKSLGNFYTLDEVIARGFDPMALRLLFLQTHYRQEMNFTWKSLEGAQTAWERLKREVLELMEKGAKKIPFQPAIPNQVPSQISVTPLNQNDPGLAIDSIIADDLNTPGLVSYLFQLLRSDLDQNIIYTAITDHIDPILGLGLAGLEPEAVSIPPEILELAEKRQQTREAKDWATSDALRNEIRDSGFTIHDTGKGYRIEKNASRVTE
ncbi:MAG: cysteine--tRNA ligase [Patescibacteria group bacterium]